MNNQEYLPENELFGDEETREELVGARGNIPPRRLHSRIQTALVSVHLPISCVFGSGAAAYPSEPTTKNSTNSVLYISLTPKLNVT